MKTHIRWMIRRDMFDVLDIEKQSFDIPWDEEDFLLRLRQRNAIGMVAEQQERILGYMVYELFPTHLHVVNFAVHPDYRRSRVGSRLIDRLVGKLTHQRRTKILLEVRETNLDAQLFFRTCGFRAISVLRDFYEDTSEDAYRMEYRYQPTLQEITQQVDNISKLLGQ